MQHLYQCLRRDIDYNPNQIQQFTQIQEPELPEFLYHLDEDKDPIPSFAMTNPYELNINRSYDDLLDVSTTYLGPDLDPLT